MNEIRFRARLFRYPGKGGWTFAPVPKRYAPVGKLAWGRTPALAAVDGKQWSTSVWTDRSGSTLLPVPKKIRGEKEDGDLVDVRLHYKQ
ncbi:MAG: DUF1905 domain-containing protein [Ignavibacteria bacterium]|nr:DUF1905 domain-containing protein [Ignavibacteria bacterium]